MRSTSQIHATIVDLVAIARAALPAREVWDGPDVSDSYARNAMWLGLDDPDAAVPTAATGVQDWGSLGANVRDERFTVYAASLAWSGDDNNAADGSADVFSMLRAQAFADIAAVETVLRSDPSAGALFTADGLRQIGMQVTFVRPMADDNGSGLLVGFQFLCWCRI